MGGLAAGPEGLKEAGIIRTGVHNRLSGLGGTSEGWEEVWRAGLRGKALERGAWQGAWRGDSRLERERGSLPGIWELVCELANS